MGRATAVELARRGFAVSVFDLRLEAAESAAAEITAAGGQALAFSGDISSSEAQAGAIGETVATFGRLDAAYANAGDQDTAGDALECDEDAWRRHIDTNITGTYLTAQLSLPHLVKSKGALLATASDAGVRPARAIVAYNTSKAAIIALIRSIAIDFGARGVRANVICPGNIETDYFRDQYQVDDSIMDGWRELVPLGRFGQPQEVAKAAAHLLTDDSSYTSGLVYVIDGAATVGYYPIRVW